MKMEKHLWYRLLAVGSLCGVLAAQAQNSAAPSTPPPANPAVPATAKPPAAQQPPAQKADDSYVIGPADVLAINVWKETEISRSIPVRSDGRISLPLIGDVQAGGRTPRQLQEEIARKLQSFISEPDVTVIVQESRSQKFNVLGQVGKPGSFLLTDSTTVLDAIAMAGGFKDFAKQKQIYVLRQNADGTQVRLPFNYKNVVKGKDLEQNVKLMPRDTVVVP
jgi:polysaccharide export outer membrane protein